MAVESDEALRERLQKLEQEASDNTAKAHAALAAAQDRSYWLDRWHVDLNALMRKPGASVVRAGFRALRAVYRLVYDTRNRTGVVVGGARERVDAARVKLAREHGDTAAPARVVPAAPGRLDATPVSDALDGQLDRDDPAALAALARADVVVDALARVGVSPAADQRWLAVGPSAGELARVLGSAHPELSCEAADEPPRADAAAAVVVAVSAWNRHEAPERLVGLRGALAPGGALVIGAERGDDDTLAPDWVAAQVTPDWRLALYLPGGIEGDRDLYVLERS